MKEIIKKTLIYIETDGKYNYFSVQVALPLAPSAGSQSIVPRCSDTGSPWTAMACRCSSHRCGVISSLTVTGLLLNILFWLKTAPRVWQLMDGSRPRWFTGVKAMEAMPAASTVTDNLSLNNLINVSSVFPPAAPQHQTRADCVVDGIAQAHLIYEAIPPCSLGVGPSVRLPPAFTDWTSPKASLIVRFRLAVLSLTLSLPPAGQYG